MAFICNFFLIGSKNKDIYFKKETPTKSIFKDFVAELERSESIDCSMQAI